MKEFDDDDFDSIDFFEALVIVAKNIPFYSIHLKDHGYRFDGMVKKWVKTIAINKEYTVEVADQIRAIIDKETVVFSGVNVKIRNSVTNTLELLESIYTKS